MTSYDPFQYVPDSGEEDSRDDDDRSTESQYLNESENESSGSSSDEEYEAMESKYTMESDTRMSVDEIRLKNIQQEPSFKPSDPDGTRWGLEPFSSYQYNVRSLPIEKEEMLNDSSPVPPVLEQKAPVPPSSKKPSL